MNRSRVLIWLGVVMLGLLAAGLAVIGFVRPVLLELTTNADALLPADLVWEILHRPATWRSFEWPRIPSMVPDMLVFGGLQAAFGWRWAQLGYSALSLMAMTGLAALIGPQVAAVTRLRAGAAFLGLTAAVLVAEAALTTTAWHLLLFPAAFHAGPFILSIAGLVLARHGRAWPLALMVAVGAVGVLSDRMFVGTFLLTLLLTLGVLWRRGELGHGAALRVGGLALLGCVIGFAVDRAVFPAILEREADVTIELLRMLRHALVVLGRRSAWYGVALNLALLVPLLRWRMGAGARFWWLAAAFASGLSTLLAAGLWEDEGTQRYLNATMWWPLVLWAAVLAARLGRGAVPLGFAAAAAAIAAFAWPAPKRLPLLAWSDPIAACLAPTGMKAGLAEYWAARPITVSSDWTVLVMQVNATGGTRVWGNDPSWYTEDRDRPGQPADFQFIVMEGLDPVAITAAYGRPDQVLPCPGSDVWLYRDPARLQAGLYKASPALVPRGRMVCVPARLLQRRGGSLPPGPITVRADRELWRPVTFGPNTDLHAGRWRVSLHYRLTTDRPGEDHWLVNGQWGQVHINRAVLPPTGPEGGVAEAVVTLGREMEAVEVPTYLAGNATLEMLGVTFTPLDGPAEACSL